MDMKRSSTCPPSPATLGLILCLSCTSGTESPTHETGGTLAADDTSLPSRDDSSSDDSSTHVDDSSVTDDSSITSGDIEWTLLDSTNGPINHQWAGCDYEKCDYSTSDSCGGVEVGIVRSEDELETLYAESLRGIDYGPEIDFASHFVVWAYLCCCTSHGPFLVVDDVTRVGKTLELSMHIDSWKLAPAAFGRPWVIVEVPIGDYDGVTHNL